MNRLNIGSDYFSRVGQFVNTKTYNSQQNINPVDIDKCYFDDKMVKKKVVELLKESNFAIVSNLPNSDKGINLDLITLWLSSFLGEIQNSKNPRKLSYAQVQLVKNSRYYISSNSSQPMHTDEGYTKCSPDIVVLLCEACSQVGGDSILVPFPPLYEILEQRFDDKINHLYHSKSFEVYNVNGIECKPLFFSYGDKVGISYSPIIKGMTCSQDSFEIFDFITKYAHNKKNQIRFKLVPGELIIIDNRQILHGRTAFPQEDNRLLYRFWFNEIKNK